MTMGHFATALVPRARMPEAPFWLLLACAQLPDLVWLALALLGVEAPHPSSALDVTMIMLYSHSGAGVAALAVVAALIVQAVWRSPRLALWCGALVAGHFACDLVSGWEHELLLPHSARVGFDLYARAPYWAFAIEAAWCAGLVAYYAVQRAARGQPLQRAAVTWLVTVFVGGSLVFVPSSYVSLRSWLASAKSAMR